MKILKIILFFSILSIIIYSGCRNEATIVSPTYIVTDLDYVHGDLTELRDSIFIEY